MWEMMRACEKCQIRLKLTLILPSNGAIATFVLCDPDPHFKVKIASSQEAVLQICLHLYGTRPQVANVYFAKIRPVRTKVNGTHTQKWKARDYSENLADL